MQSHDWFKFCSSAVAKLVLANALMESIHAANARSPLFGLKKQKLTPSFTSLHSGIRTKSGGTSPCTAIRCAVRFRPCIDIHKGKVKQIVGSTLLDINGESSELITNFESEKSSAEFAKLYKIDGLLGGHVIMLGADSASKSAALEALNAYPGGLQVGGGINGDNARMYLEAGASHVIVTSYAFNNGKLDMERLRDLVQDIGKPRLVLDLSCRRKNGKYIIVTDRWQKFSNVELNEETLNTLSAYADEFLVHGVDVEGKRLGIDEELVGLLGRCSPIPVTYAGGATSITDLECIRIAGAGFVDATVGSALDIFGGNLPYKEVVAWHAKQQIGA